jgi:aspartate-semialdehyde dehydrogenase
MPNFNNFEPLKEKIPVAILGATGTVGQRFIQLLENHPWFEITVLAGSERSRGQLYKDVTNWLLPTELPKHIAELEVQPIAPIYEAKVVFSALPTKYALEWEPKFAEAGYAVVSNASAFRQTSDIPLLIPELNPQHTDLIAQQQANRGWSGFIVTSPNCSTTGIAMPLKVLDDNFGVSTVFAATLQAISGAGYPGISSFDIHDNVIPYIGGEEGKIEAETQILLGEINSDGKQPHSMVVSAQTNRVNVLDGHTANISVRLNSPASLEEISEAWERFNQRLEEQLLPSSPPRIIESFTQVARPQPRLDINIGGGMAVSVGQVRPCPLLDYKITTLVHNTVRGAAGGAILNAELLVEQGYIEAPALIGEKNGIINK